MSLNEEPRGHPGLDSGDHQTAYIFAPSSVIENAAPRPVKKRKIAKHKAGAGARIQTNAAPAFEFERLLNGTESLQAASLRQKLYTRYWSETESQIQAVLEEANHGTLAEVVSFVERSSSLAETALLPTGFIVTGPNISSQELLFKQLSGRLRHKINGPTVLLRSGDASNLKASLKQIIRDATNQKNTTEDDEETDHVEQFDRKTLNYDLEILHRFVEANKSQAAIVVFQDSEAFDNDLLADLIKLFSSWSNRIPFVLLFGIATSVALFHERLSRSASRLLSGAQFDVENTNVVLERIFRKSVMGARVPLRLGATLVTSLMARQKHHVQSVQSFTTALKYAYMCHFYGNALSILNDTALGMPIITPDHLEAVRMLPSFRRFVGTHSDTRPVFVRELLTDDETLSQAIEEHLELGKAEVLRMLRVVHLLSSVTQEDQTPIDLYIAAFGGTLSTSDFVQRVIVSTKRMDPEELLTFLKRLKDVVDAGCPELDLLGWAEDASDVLQNLAVIAAEITSLVEESEKTNNPVRSSYAIQNKGLRTTVIAQRVQLSYEKSKLSRQDQAFTKLVDDVTKILQDLLTCLKPEDIFLNEIWLYNSITPYEDVFTPRPRYAVEHALTTPHDYLDCACCKSDEGLPATQPATASLYQMYLQAGSLVNIADLWTTFLDNQNQNDDENFDEREAMVQFYQGLVDLKLLGMVKHSKKKVDHLAKILWGGL